MEDGGENHTGWACQWCRNAQGCETGDGDDAEAHDGDDSDAASDSMESGKAGFFGFCDGSENVCEGASRRFYG